MSKYRFDQIAINSTAKKKPTEEDKYHYIGLEHIDSQNLIVSRWGSEIAPKGEKLLMKKGDVLFGKRRAYQKKVAIAPFDGIFSAHGMVLRPNEEVVDKDFFPMFISSDYFLDAAIAISVGSLSPTINWKDLARLEFDLPPMEEQKKLAEVLWSINDTLQAYQNLLAQTDALVQAQFEEMFGDPYTNPKQWKKCTIDSIIREKVSNGFFAKQTDYCEDGNASIICVGDVVNRKYSNIAQLRRTNATDKDFERFRVKYGDALFCRSSLVKEGIGKASIVPETATDDVLFECHVIRVPLDTSKVVPEFFQGLTSSNYFRDQMMSKAKTATMTTIGQNDIVTTEIFLPTMLLQLQFKEFSKQIDKSKSTLQNTITSLQATKRSILERALGTGRKE